MLVPFQLDSPMHYTYLLQSEKDGRWYAGQTRDLRSRVGEHVRGKVASTRHRRPLRLVYYEACLRQAGLPDRVGCETKGTVPQDGKGEEVPTAATCFLVVDLPR
jgi:putative endonuclease